MRLLRNKRQAALATAPGMYAEEDPSKVIFETSTRLKLESNRWMLIAFACAAIAAGAVWTRQPPPSVVRVVGVAADVTGHPISTDLVAYKPDSQALRTHFKDMAIRWFTIEPVLTDRLETSRMTTNINSVKHVKFLVDLWVKDGQSGGTIENKLTYMRALIVWMGKPNLVGWSRI